MANLPFPMVPNQDLTAEFFNASINNMRSVAYQTADATINNEAVNIQTSTDLVLGPLPGGAEFIFESCIFYDTSATADIQIVIQLPFIGAMLIAPWSSGTAIIGSTNNINQQGSGSTTSFNQNIVAGGVASGTVMSIRPTGWLRMDISSGSLSIGFLQNTATASNTLLKQGSWIALTRVL